MATMENAKATISKSAHQIRPLLLTPIHIHKILPQVS